MNVQGSANHHEILAAGKGWCRGYISNTGSYYSSGGSGYASQVSLPAVTPRSPGDKSLSEPMTWHRLLNLDPP